MEINIDYDKLNKSIRKAFDNTVDKFGEVLQEAIEEKYYEYPRTTYRRSGEIADSPRNIVDLGNLRDSQMVTRSSSQYHVEYSWDVPYAMAVHEGYTTRAGNIVPDRRWTEKALEIEHPQSIFENELGGEF